MAVLSSLASKLRYRGNPNFEFYLLGWESGDYRVVGRGPMGQSYSPPGWGAGAQVRTSQRL
jgi:hypothetical protein